MKGLITLCETVEDLRRALAACWGRGIQATVPSRGDQLEVLMERPIDPRGAYLSTRSAYALPIRKALRKPGRYFRLRYPPGVSWRGRPLACARVVLPDAPTLRTRETWAQIVEALGGEVATRLDDVDLVIGAAPPALSEGATRAPVCVDEVRVFDALVPTRLRALGTRPSGPVADPVTAERLVALICAEDPAHQAQGVALLAALDDPAICEALLVGIRFEGRQLRPSRVLKGASPQALVELVAAAEHPRAQALREAVTALSAPLTELRSLAAYPNLRRLSLERSSLERLDGIGDCAALEELSVRECVGLSRLDGIGAPPRLRSLSLAFCSGLTDLQAIGGCAALELLDLRSCGALTSLRGLGACRSLQRLNLHGCMGVIAAPELGQLPALRSLSAEPALQAWMARRLGSAE